MKHFTVLALAIGFLPACATVTKGTTDEVMVTSKPSHAIVTTTLGFHGTTPARIEHKRKKKFTVTVEAEGYKPVEIYIDNRFSGTGAAGLAGNILLGGVVGLAVDGVTGSTLDHYPADVFVELMPLAGEGEARITVQEPENKVAITEDNEEDI